MKWKQRRTICPPALCWPDHIA